MLEFVIARRDGNRFFDLPYDQWAAVLRPSTLPSHPLIESGPGNHIIEVTGYRINFIDEMPGLQVIIESKDMPYELARQVLDEICQNIVHATGSTYELLEMPSDRPYRFA